MIGSGIPIPLLLATATAGSASALIVLFFAQMASWAGVPALGAATSGAAATLANQGTLSLWAVLIVGTAGAEIGSFGGWWLGRRVARAGVDGHRKSDEKRRKALATGERIEHKWGRLIVFFVPSWVSGALGMPLSQFARWNLLAALLWNAGAALAAYGIASAVTGKPVGHVIVALALVVAIAVATGWLFKAFRRRSAPPAGEAATPG